MKIVPDKSQDADALTEIAIEAKRHSGYPASWIDSWREDLTVRPEHVIEREIQSATVDGRITGFYAIAVEGARLRLLDLSVLPEAMGNGIGRSLFTHALNRARERGFVALEIESDPNAEGFDLRMGAKRIGSRFTEVNGHPRELPLLICQVPNGIPPPG